MRVTLAWSLRAGLALLMVCGSSMGPVLAGTPAGQTGLATGTMAFGKQLECDHHGGASNPAGAGMPFSPLAPPKSAWARVDMALTPFDEVGGRLTLCVRLQPIASNVNGGIGATCDLSKGHGGTGKIVRDDGSPTVWLDQVGWKSSVLTTSGTYYALTGRARSDHAGAYPKAKDKPAGEGMFVALLEAQNSECFFDGPTKDSKTDESEGHHVSPGFVVYAVEPLSSPGLQAAPGVCKADSDICLYGPKE